MASCLLAGLTLLVSATPSAADDLDNCSFSIALVLHPDQVTTPDAFKTRPAPYNPATDPAFLGGPGSADPFLAQIATNALSNAALAQARRPDRRLALVREVQCAAPDPTGLDELDDADPGVTWRHDASLGGATDGGSDAIGFGPRHAPGASAGGDLGLFATLIPIADVAPGQSPAAPETGGLPPLTTSSLWGGGSGQSFDGGGGVGMGFGGGFGGFPAALPSLAAPADPATAPTDPTSPLTPLDPTSLAPAAGGVPEPATWSLLVLGLGSLGALLRRARAFDGDGRMAA